MSNEQDKVSIDYIKLTLEQAEKVEKLALQTKSSEDPKEILQLEIEMEALAFYQNTAKGNPRRRAAKVIDIARSTVLGRAVTQPLPKVGI